MIILKLKKSNYKIKDILKKYNECIELQLLKCSSCDSSKLIKWGTYKRNIYYVENEKIEHEIIIVLRVKCKTCNRTHALLIEYIIPYKQHLLDVILHALEDTEVIKQYKFSEDTINRWRKQFNKFLSYLRTMLSKVNAIIAYIINHIFEVYEDFYIINKKILMMVRFGIIGMCYF